MPYPHRQNRDGSIDAICPRCYVTIASSVCEAELERMEAAHVCDPALLEYFDGQRGQTKKKPQSDDPQAVLPAQRHG
jgi:hypothetical protein